MPHFWNFWTRLISLEQLKIETSNLALRMMTMPSLIHFSTCSVIPVKHRKLKFYQFRPKMRQNAFSGRAPPGPAGGA